MISPQKLKLLSNLQILPMNEGDFGKIVVAKGFEKLPKVQYIAQSGHTARVQKNCNEFISRINSKISKK